MYVSVLTGRSTVILDFGSKRRKIKKGAQPPTLARRAESNELLFAPLWAPWGRKVIRVQVPDLRTEPTCQSVV